MSNAEGIRLYGTESGRDYTVTVKRVDNGDYVMDFIVTMKNYPYVTDAVNNVTDLIPIEFYGFRAPSREKFCYLDIRTTLGDATVTIVEEGEIKFAAYPENYAFQWAQSIYEGTHVVNISIARTGYTTTTRNSSYVVMEDDFFIRTFDFSVGDEYLTMFVDTSWNNATLTVWVTPRSPNAPVAVVINGTSENDELEWKITNDEMNANWVNVDTKIIGNTTHYEWRNFTYSYIKSEERVFPAYRKEFDSVKATIASFGSLTNQLLLITVAAIVGLAYLQYRNPKKLLREPLVKREKGR